MRPKRPDESSKVLLNGREAALWPFIVGTTQCDEDDMSTNHRGLGAIAIEPAFIACVVPFAMQFVNDHITKIVCMNLAPEVKEEVLEEIQGFGTVEGIACKGR